MWELRAACQMAEEERDGGFSLRTSPLIHVRPCTFRSLGSAQFYCTHLYLSLLPRTSRACPATSSEVSSAPRLHASMFSSVKQHSMHRLRFEPSNGSRRIVGQCWTACASFAGYAPLDVRPFPDVLACIYREGDPVITRIGMLQPQPESCMNDSASAAFAGREAVFHKEALHCQKH